MPTGIMFARGRSLGDHCIPCFILGLLECKLWLFSHDITSLEWVGKAYEESSEWDDKSCDRGSVCASICQCARNPNRHRQADYGLNSPSNSSAQVCSVTEALWSLSVPRPFPLGMNTRDCRVPWLECSGTWQSWGLSLNGSSSTAETLTLFWGYRQAACPSTSKITPSSESLLYLLREELWDQGRPRPTSRTREKPARN